MNYETVADELFIFAVNDRQLYDTRFKSWINNFARKMKRGVYTSELGLKGMVNLLVPDVIAKYRKEFGIGTVDKDARQLLGKYLLERIEEQARFKVNEERAL